MFSSLAILASTTFHLCTHIYLLLVGQERIRKNIQWFSSRFIESKQCNCSTLNDPWHDPRLFSVCWVNFIQIMDTSRVWKYFNLAKFYAYDLVQVQFNTYKEVVINSSICSNRFGLLWSRWQLSDMEVNNWKVYCVVIEVLKIFFL